MNKTIENYKRRLRFANMQPSTIKSYSKNLEDFFRYTQTDKITDSMIEDYLDRLRRQEYQ